MLSRAMIIVQAALAVGACAGSTAETAPESTADTPARQVALGQSLYAANCASCHGSGGEGLTAPRLVGLAQGALPLEPPPGARFRTSRFETVMDVAAFAVANMPPKRAGVAQATLSNEDYWAVLAFDLHANGIDLPEPLGPELAKTLVIPR